MPVRLVSAASGKTIKLDKPVVLIGRNPDCDVVLTKSRKVSRAHCLVACVNNRIVVRDLGSTNGVWINGQRVERESRVRLGDELSVADVRYHLVNVDQNQDNGKSRKKRKSKKKPNVPHVVPASQPVPLPDEDDSFIVEATSPRLPRVTPEQLAATRAADDDSSCDVIPLDEEAQRLLDSAHAQPLEVPETSSEIEQAEILEPGGLSPDGFHMDDEDEDESDEAFSILDSVNESNDIVPLASVDDEDDSSEVV